MKSILKQEWGCCGTDETARPLQRGTDEHDRKPEPVQATCFFLLKKSASSVEIRSLQYYIDKFKSSF